MKMQYLSTQHFFLHPKTAHHPYKHVHCRQLRFLRLQELVFVANSFRTKEPSKGEVLSCVPPEEA